VIVAGVDAVEQYCSAKARQAAVLIPADETRPDRSAPVPRILPGTRTCCCRQKGSRDCAGELRAREAAGTSVGDHRSGSCDPRRVRPQHNERCARTAGPGTKHVVTDRKNSAASGCRFRGNRRLRQQCGPAGEEIGSTAMALAAGALSASKPQTLDQSEVGHCRIPSEFQESPLGGRQRGP